MNKSDLFSKGQNLVLTTALLVAVLVIAARVVQAAGGAVAFGYRDLPDIKGQRVYIWTGNPPAGLAWTAAPVAVCKDYNCAEKFVETGWVKGVEKPYPDRLQQYVSYKDIDGKTKQVFRSDWGFNANTWYQVKVMYSQSANRWEAWLFNDVPWYAPNDLGWNSGTVLVVGSEAKSSGNWMNVYGWHPEYRLWSGSNWILYNYTSSGTAGGGHISHNYDYGYHAWGP